MKTKVLYILLLLWMACSFASAQLTRYPVHHVTSDEVVYVVTSKCTPATASTMPTLPFQSTSSSLSPRRRASGDDDDLDDLGGGDGPGILPPGVNDDKDNDGIVDDYSTYQPVGSAVLPLLLMLMGYALLLHRRRKQEVCE